MWMLLLLSSPWLFRSYLLLLLGSSQIMFRVWLFGLLGLHDVGDGVVVSGLKCVSHLLVVGNRTTWSDVSHLFGVVLGFVADSRLKVRRHAHVCLRDVMQGFQDTPVLSPASEAIASTFERFLLLAGGSNPNPNP
ncbi:hypothetical protein HanRHA438_Chr00c70g0862301 [Helianthus annuus]|nr:hypothetical protein HanRHA438_Chr00c70g0862301 [Helianthus annuus]